MIENLEASAPGTQGGSPAVPTLPVKFSARDAGTSVERAQYSVDGGDWILIAPAGNISDAPEERYEFRVEGLVAGEHTIAVRAYDRFENVGSAKITVIVPAPSAAK